MRLPYHLPSCNPHHTSPSPASSGRGSRRPSSSAPSSARASSRRAATSPRTSPSSGWRWRVWVLGGLLALLGRARARRGRRPLPARRRQLRLPARGLRPDGRVPLGLGRVLDHPLGVHRGARHDVHRVLPRRAQTIAPPRRTRRWRCSAFWPRQLLTALVIAGLAAVNARGTRLGGGLQFVITIVKVGVAALHHRAAVRGLRRGERADASAEGRTLPPDLARKLARRELVALRRGPRRRALGVPRLDEHRARSPRR